MMMILQNLVQLWLLKSLTQKMVPHIIGASKNYGNFGLKFSSKELIRNFWEFALK